MALNFPAIGAKVLKKVDKHMEMWESMVRALEAANPGTFGFSDFGISGFQEHQEDGYMQRNFWEEYREERERYIKELGAQWEAECRVGTALWHQAKNIFTQESEIQKSRNTEMVERFYTVSVRPRPEAVWNDFYKACRAVSLALDEHMADLGIGGLCNYGGVEDKTLEQWMAAKEQGFPGQVKCCSLTSSFEQKSLEDGTPPLGDGFHWHAVTYFQGTVSDLQTFVWTILNDHDVPIAKHVGVKVKMAKTPAKHVHDYLWAYRSKDGHKEQTMMADYAWRQREGLEALYYGPLPLR